MKKQIIGSTLLFMVSFLISPVLAQNSELFLYAYNSIKSLEENETEQNTSEKNYGSNFEIRVQNNGINYKLDDSSLVKITLFDHDNNEIGFLVNRMQSSGNYFVNFSTINLESGIYKYCISVDNNMDLS